MHSYFLCIILEEVKSIIFYTVVMIEALQGINVIMSSADGSRQTDGFKLPTRRKQRPPEALFTLHKSPALTVFTSC